MLFHPVFLICAGLTGLFKFAFGEMLPLSDEGESLCSGCDSTCFRPPSETCRRKASILQIPRKDQNATDSAQEAKCLFSGVYWGWIVTGPMFLQIRFPY
jgi:hypothetical protein